MDLFDIDSKIEQVERIADVAIEKISRAAEDVIEKAAAHFLKKVATVAIGIATCEKGKMELRLLNIMKWKFKKLLLNISLGMWDRIKMATNVYR